jgi:hypothetical protein
MGKGLNVPANGWNAFGGLDARYTWQLIESRQFTLRQDTFVLMHVPEI